MTSPDRPGQRGVFVSATRTPAALLALLLGLLALPARAQEPIPSPESFFGHAMGADRKLVHYDAALPYYRLVAERSDRVRLETIGTTTEGRDLIMVLLSSPENLARADHYRRISALLNDPRDLSEAEIASLVAEGKTILLITLNIHSTEIASSQMGLEWVYGMATGGPESHARFLDDVIVLLVPSVNPDGQAKVTEWYREYVGTKYEGGWMPWLYHRYAGHDNNRDWFMLNLAETQAVNRIAYHEWFPQVLVDEHQMGPTGPRAFVPPYADPVSERVHPLIHRGSHLIGAAMAMDLERGGKTGVIYGYSFDAYWPGGTRSTPWWKNTVGILTEIASARVATPIYVDAGELSGGRKGLPDYRPQVNFPNPWAGGWWRMRDIVEYELIITDSVLKSCALHRKDFLSNRAAMARDAVYAGQTEPPFGYVIPPEQHDPGTAARLVDLLRENGLEAYRVESDERAGIQIVPRGSFVFPAAQPFRAFLIEMMEPQIYPEIRVDPGSDEVYEPYDVTSWTLPYLMGVRSFRLEARLDAPLTPVTEIAWTEPAIVEGTGAGWALSPRSNDSYTAALRLLAAGERVDQVGAEFRWKGFTWPAGTFLVSCERPALAAALDGLRTQAHSVNPPVAASEATAENGYLADRSRGVTLRRLRVPRLGVYQPWLASMDEGWTRFVLDRFEVPYTVLHNEEIQKGGLERSFDVILLPDMEQTELVDGKDAVRRGHYRRRRPDPYDGGMGTAGIEALAAFVERGGTLVTMGEAAELALGELNLPVEDATASLPPDEFHTPGSMLRIRVDTGHPLGYGMPEEAMVYHDTDPVLVTQVPGAESRRVVVARYLEPEEVLASGWARGLRVLDRKAAAVEVSVGEGTVVLLAFRPQYRGQTQGTYRFLFNSFLNAAAE